MSRIYFEKNYIYKRDIQKFLKCSHSKADEVFSKVKDYELDVLEYELFENRVPASIFNEWISKRKKRSK